MPEEPARTPDLRFRLLDCGRRQPRVHPFALRWRRLPCTLIEVTEGGVYHVEWEGAAAFDSDPGCPFVIPAEVRHRFAMRKGPPMTITWALVSFTTGWGLDVVRAAGVPTRFPPGASARVFGLLDELNALRDPAQRMEGRALAALQRAGFQMLEVFLEHAEMPRLQPPDLALERVGPALKHIHARFAERLTRAEIARQAFLSPTRFHAVFRKATGIPPGEYVLRVRLQHARELLASTSLPSYAIAERSGFASPHYFCRAFRKRVGLTPMAFRESLRERS